MYICKDLCTIYLLFYLKYSAHPLLIVKFNKVKLNLS